MFRLIFSLIFLFSLNNPAFASKAMKVLIDPGHGGNDYGATRSNVKESKISLSISKILFNILKTNPEFSVHLTRKTDKNISLFKRAETARKIKADLLLSIHVNTSTDIKAKGAEFYIQSQLPAEKESLFLAYKENNQIDAASRIKNWPLNFIKKYSSLEPNLRNILHDINRGYLIQTSSVLAKSLSENWKGIKKSKRHSLKQAPFYVISNVNIPAVLIEVGFLTHPQEFLKLNQKTYQKTIARSIYRSLIDYKKRLHKSTTTHLY